MGCVRAMTLGSCRPEEVTAMGSEQEKKEKEEKENRIFGTPPPPKNEAEEQAERDWIKSAPEPVTVKEMESWSPTEAGIYYEQGGQEP